MTNRSTLNRTSYLMKCNRQRQRIECCSGACRSMVHQRCTLLQRNCSCQVIKKLLCLPCESSTCKACSSTFYSGGWTAAQHRQALRATALTKMAPSGAAGSPPAPPLKKGTDARAASDAAAAASAAASCALSRAASSVAAAASSAAACTSCCAAMSSS